MVARNSGADAKSANAGSCKTELAVCLNDHRKKNYDYECLEIVKNISPKYLFFRSRIRVFHDLKPKFILTTIVV